MDSQNSIDSLSSIVDNFGYSTYYYHLLKTKQCVDVTFIIESEEGKVEVYAHQLILAMRSTYYADLFYGKEKGRKIKQNQVIRLGKMNAKVFEDMIRFCYDCKPGLETLQETCTLFRIADQFKVITLMNLCRTRLSEMEINPGNIFYMLEVSELMKDRKLIDACQNFLEENTAHVMNLYEMAQVTSSMVRVILALPKLSLNSEFELINWIMDWARAKVEEGVCKSAREHLKNFLPGMNFLALDFVKFATLCKDYPDIFTAGEIACIFLNIAHPGIKEMPMWYGKKMKVREYTGEDLRSKLIRNINGDKKWVICVKNVEKVLKSWKESVKCFSEENKNFAKQDYGVYELFLFKYISFKHFYFCWAVFMKILKLRGKEEKVSEAEKDIRFDVTMQGFERLFILLEGGAETDILLRPEEVKVVQDDVFERMKKEHANETRAEKFKEHLQGAEEYQRRRKMLHNIEESGILRILDDLYEMYKLHLDSEKLKISFMVKEKLWDDCYGLVKELKEIHREDRIFPS